MLAALASTITFVRAGQRVGWQFAERPLFPVRPQQHGHAAAAIIFDYHRPPMPYRQSPLSVLDFLKNFCSTEPLYISGHLK